MTVQDHAGDKPLPSAPSVRETPCCSLSAGPLTSEQAEHYAALFKVLADPGRIQLLSQIAEEGCEPMSVSELTERSGLSQPTVSHHLKKLTEAGLVERSRTGRTVTHQVRPEVFAQLRTVLQMD